MAKTKKAKSKAKSTFDWWLALDPCSAPTVRQKRKPKDINNPGIVEKTSSSQADKVARSMDALSKRILKAQSRYSFSAEEMLAWYVNVIGLYRADHLWDETIPSYSELLTDYIEFKRSAGGSPSAAEAERASSRPAGRRPAKTLR